MKKFSLILCSIVIFLTSFAVNAQTVDEYEAFQLKALKDCNKFGVYVWDFEGDKLDKGLTEKEIEKFVIKSLKGAGIHAVEFADSKGIEGAPCVEVSIRVDNEPKNNLYAYSVIVRFIQDVKLKRNNMPHYSAITWERDEVGLSTAKDVQLELKISINSLLDEFIKDFYKVNKNKLKNRK